ncbi:MAG: transporter substrate-binding domain-containing protein [Bacteroidia bacterium]|nr:transporter substrate-binding domain-containing protein [Bacteroidia bacterium]
MAKHIVACSLLVCLLVAPCCNRPEKESFATESRVNLDLDEIVIRGYINALVDNNSTSYFIYRGRPMGYEYELLERFASYLKVELKIKLIASIEEAIDLLNKGQGDVIAFPLTITKERTNYVAFSNTHYNTYQVLIQKKPDNWNANPHLAEKKLIRNPADLIGKEIYVKKGSAFKDRLENLSDEIGGEIIIREDSADSETEALIEKVATGEIPLTVNDQTIAMVNASYYPEIDVKTVLSLPQQIAWAVRNNSPKMLESLNKWLSGVKKTGTFNVIFKKYFNSPRTSLKRANSDFSSLGGNKLSPYDEYIKEAANLLAWDWRLVASVMYQESNFDPGAQSWAGASGLMQLMPETAEQFGVNNIFDPGQNIKAGAQFLKYLDNQWAKSINDPGERLKFVLASYNVGLSHVLDARNLTKKYGRNPTLWDNNVEYYLLQKSNPKYYRDDVAVAGFCRCTGPVKYVKEVLQRYEEYKIHIP